MFFELKGKTYRVKFFRDGRTYMAELHEVKEGDGIVHLGLLGIARCDSRDQFVKSRGRKQALANLLEGLADPKMTEDTGLLFSKEDKMIVWEAYFKNHKK